MGKKKKNTRANFNVGTWQKKSTKTTKSSPKSLIYNENCFVSVLLVEFQKAAFTLKANDTFEVI